MIFVFLQTLDGHDHIFRHPFEKLVSCYKDKFETGSKNDYIFQKFNPSIIESKTDRPTFVEFVEYLIRTPIEMYNDHWLPNWIHCQVCTQNYDIIGKNLLGMYSGVPNKRAARLFVCGKNFHPSRPY